MRAFNECRPLYPITYQPYLPTDQLNQHTNMDSAFS